MSRDQRHDTAMTAMDAEEAEDRSCDTPEQCFYASFKIYLSDSRKNSVCESDDSGMETKKESSKIGWINWISNNINTL